MTILYIWLWSSGSKFLSDSFRVLWILVQIFWFGAVILIIWFTIYSLLSENYCQWIPYNFSRALVTFFCELLKTIDYLCRKSRLCLGVCRICWKFIFFGFQKLNQTVIEFWKPKTRIWRRCELRVWQLDNVGRSLPQPILISRYNEQQRSRSNSSSRHGGILLCLKKVKGKDTGPAV